MSEGFTAYYWKGEPITDIRQWCRDRGEKMIRVLIIPEPKPNPFTGQVSKTEPYEHEIPESFFVNYCSSGENIRILERFEP